MVHRIAVIKKNRDGEKGFSLLEVIIVILPDSSLTIISYQKVYFIAAVYYAAVDKSG